MLIEKQRIVRDLKLAQLSILNDVSKELSLPTAASR